MARAPPESPAAQAGVPRRTFTRCLPGPPQRSRAFSRMCILLTFIRESRLARAGRKSPWRPLSALPDRKLPKLENLRRARRRGIATVEPTFWAAAHDLEGQGNLDLPGLAKLVGFPCILRSCSPTEDTLQGSQAGRFVSVIVHRPEAMAGALARHLVVTGRVWPADGSRRGTAFPGRLQGRGHVLRRFLFRGNGGLWPEYGRYVGPEARAGLSWPHHARRSAERLAASSPSAHWRPARCGVDGGCRWTAHPDSGPAGPVPGSQVRNPEPSQQQGDAGRGSQPVDRRSVRRRGTSGARIRPPRRSATAGLE